MPSKGKLAGARRKDTSRPAEGLRPEAPAVVNGWRLYFHPLFLDQLEVLTAAAEREQAAGRPGGTPPTSNAKVLKGVLDFALVRIPANPGALEFRQGKTLGAERTHWLRAKFGAGRFRLFFRYRAARKVVVYAWVNDSTTLRTYGDHDDAYAVFGRMLDRGNPPDDLDALIQAAAREGERAQRLLRAVRER